MSPTNIGQNLDFGWIFLRKGWEECSSGFLFFYGDDSIHTYRRVGNMDPTPHHTLPSLPCSYPVCNLAKTLGRHGIFPTISRLRRVATLVRRAYGTPCIHPRGGRKTQDARHGERTGRERRVWSTGECQPVRAEVGGYLKHLGPSNYIHTTSTHYNSNPAIFPIRRV